MVHCECNNFLFYYSFTWKVVTVVENLKVGFGDQGFSPKVVVPLYESEKTLAQAVGRINREGKYAKVFSEDGITNHEDTDLYSGYDYQWSTWGATCGLEILSESGARVGVIRFLDLSVANQHLFTALAWRGGCATGWKLTLNDPADKEATFTLYEVNNGISLPEKKKGK
jgi:hypothetical protein